MINLKANIQSFFIFNSKFGPKEGEELKRILYFYPSNVNSDGQKMQVGLCEAVVKFMATFSSEPCEALQTQKRRHVFYQPEKDYWMVMIVKIPYATKPAVAVGDSRKLNEDGSKMVPKAVSDVLVSAYKMFKLFLGPLANISADDIYTKCENFFTPYISQRSLTNEVSAVIQGISYLPLDKSSFFKVMCFIDLVEAKYPLMKCVAFFYNDQVLWNGLSPSDTLTIYKYLVNTLLPELVEKEIHGGAVAAAQRHGRFISPPQGIKSDEDLKNISIVYISSEKNENELERHYFFVYRTLSATVCFTIDAKETLNLESFRSLDTFIGPQLSTIASTIGEQVALQALQTVQNNDTKFVYFNRQNLAFKTSTNANKLVPSSMVRPEVVNFISDMHADRKSLGCYGEIIIKTTDDYWITGKTSNEREFYVIIQQKNANLKEISDEVKRVCDAQMKGIFFYPV